MTLTKANVITIVKMVSAETDSFDQVTRGQCRKLIRLLDPVNRNFSKLDLLLSMLNSKFSQDFIDIVEGRLDRIEAQSQQDL